MEVVSEELEDIIKVFLVPKMEEKRNASSQKQDERIFISKSHNKQKQPSQGVSAAWIIRIKRCTWVSRTMTIDSSYCSYNRNFERFSDDAQFSSQKAKNIMTAIEERINELVLASENVLNNSKKVLFSEASLSKINDVKEGNL